MSGSIYGEPNVSMSGMDLPKKTSYITRGLDKVKGSFRRKFRKTDEEKFRRQRKRSRKDGSFIRPKWNSTQGGGKRKRRKTRRKSKRTKRRSRRTRR